jgi:hypothetical protein
MLSPMASRLHSVYVWWTTHSGWVNFIYFVIAVWISLFTARAREFVIAPFRYSAARMNLKARRDLQNQLVTIKSIHNDTYKLAMYVAYGAVDAVVWSGIMTVCFYFFLIVVAMVMHDKFTLSIGPYSMFFGGIIGRATVMRQTLGYLYNYDESVKMLEAATAEPLPKP